MIDEFESDDAPEDTQADQPNEEFQVNQDIDDGLTTEKELDDIDSLLDPTRDSSSNNKNAQIPIKADVKTEDVGTVTDKGTANASEDDNSEDAPKQVKNTISLDGPEVNQPDKTKSDESDVNQIDELENDGRPGNAAENDDDEVEMDSVEQENDRNGDQPQQDNFLDSGSISDNGQEVCA